MHGKRGARTLRRKQQYTASVISGDLRSAFAEDVPECVVYRYDLQNWTKQSIEVGAALHEFGGNNFLRTKKMVRIGLLKETDDYLEVLADELGNGSLICTEKAVYSVRGFDDFKENL